MYAGYIAICVVARDQHIDVREWVQYHKFVGVSKIYFYDHSQAKAVFKEN